MVVATERYQLIDDIPELAFERNMVREQAWAVLNERKHRQHLGDFEQLPLQIDALSTARAVLDTEEIHGTGSIEHGQALEGLQLDCQRLVSEWYRKRTWEYFPKSRHYFNAQTGEFYSHGLSVRQMTENALTPHIGNHEEEARRINERVEDDTPLIINKLGSFALDHVGIRTVSECSDQAISDYETDMSSGAKHRGYGGYVPEIQKVMIRDITIDPETGDRIEEQVGLSGTYITHQIFQTALAERGVDASYMDKTDLHGAQMLVEDDLIDFVSHLDRVASREWCTNIFMGEVVDDDFDADYSSVRSEAAERQKQLSGNAKLVADFVLDLAKNQTDSRQAPGLVEEFVKKMLLRVAADDHELAQQIFDKRTADGLRRVSYLQSIGQTNQALEAMIKVEKSAPGGGFCGAGSCGLESMSGSIESKLVKDKLGFGNGKDVIKDTERKCVCGSKTVYYDLKQSKKGCTTCGRTTKY